ncbi:MAG: DNA repair protein RecO [Firmicutes bacterium]|jgi:DNA repair protein RecO (recombination protein O)|nr:DNA repair protein RecO [Bacillota bacterium]
MKLFKTEAAVLRTRELGEADRLVTLLSRERGKINAVARGARKIKSKLAAGVDLFTHGNYMLYQGKTLATVTQQEILETFAHLKEDPAAYAHALYFSELVDKVLVEEARSRKVLGLLIDAWRVLKEDRDFFLLARAFEIKLLSAVGYHPHFTACAGCNAEEKGYFSPGMGGLVCRSCAGKDLQARSFSGGAEKLVKYFMDHSFEEIGVVRGSPSQKSEIRDFTMGMIGYYLEVGECKSLKYIRRHFPDGE